jgi:cell fate (sporulation/competence/biofilm development) regulator YmcA (YheA/YmcA/DUF963 family)
LLQYSFCATQTINANKTAHVDVSEITKMPAMLDAQKQLENLELMILTIKMVEEYQAKLKKEQNLL